MWWLLDITLPRKVGYSSLIKDKKKKKRKDELPIRLLIDNVHKKRGDNGNRLSTHVFT